MEVIKSTKDLLTALYELERGQIVYAKHGLYEKVAHMVVGKSFTVKKLQDKVEITCSH